MSWDGSGAYGQTLLVDPLGSTQSGLDLTADTLKTVLRTSDYTPDFNDTTAAYGTTDEVEGTGYTAGGLAVVDAALSLSSGIVTWDADDPEWDGTTLSDVRGAEIHDPALTNGLIAGWDFGLAYNTSDGKITLTVNALGLVTFDFIPS